MIMDWSKLMTRMSMGLKYEWMQRKHNLLALLILLLLTQAFSVFAASTGRNKHIHLNTGCNFPAIFNFGDSNSDTGSKSSAFGRIPYPNGYSFFHKPAGRFCDGRVVVDFIAERLELPYLSSYLDSIGTNFRHGANFATGGATIQRVDTRLCAYRFSPLSLDLQLSQFEQFKERTLELHNQGGSSYVMNSLPMPDDFSKALYTLDIGQNDLHAGFKSMTDEQVLESIPSIVVQLAKVVEKLYRLGARAFWVHNTGPIGCLPMIVAEFPQKPENLDQNGCANSLNDIAQEFNRQLKDKVFQLRKQFPDAALTYTDIYTAKYSLISEAKKQGFSDLFGYCCGHYGDPCWKKAKANGTETSRKPCNNPELDISWDGIHYSQAANRIIADKIVNGSMSDPPTPINEACRKPSLFISQNVEEA